MFGIPEWALGVGLIMIIGSLIRGRRPGVIDGLGRKRGWRETAQTLEDLERRLAAVEEAHGQGGAGAETERRIGELEERVDFTERLLAKQKDADRVGPPRT
jgi:hypothetical protein